LERVLTQTGDGIAVSSNTSEHIFVLCPAATSTVESKEKALVRAFLARDAAWYWENRERLLPEYDMQWVAIHYNGRIAAHTGLLQNAKS